MTSSDAPTGTGRGNRVTIIDVARHAGVSTAAASKVLRNAYGVSDGMRERVQASIAVLGYRPHRPARGMRGSTYTVGMVVPDIENPFFNLVSDGASRVLSAERYELLIALPGLSSTGWVDAMDSLVDHRVDGLLLVAPPVAQEEIDRIARQVPVVVLGHHNSSGLLDSVASDDVMGADLVVDHLAALGHRRIAFVANPLEYHDPERLESVRHDGFLRAVRRRGLDRDAVVIDGDWTLDGGFAAARAVSALAEAPTAVFTGADVVAFGMLSDWWARDVRVPRDFSLVGYDNSKTSSLGPIDLTTVDQAGPEMGSLSGLLLLERIGGRQEAEHRLLTPRLVLRGTTAPVAR